MLQESLEHLLKQYTESPAPGSSESGSHVFLPGSADCAAIGSLSAPTGVTCCEAVSPKSQDDFETRRTNFFKAYVELEGSGRDYSKIKTAIQILMERGFLAGVYTCFGPDTITISQLPLLPGSVSPRYFAE